MKERNVKMKKSSIVWVVAGLMILVGCVSAERQAEYAAWQDSEDGVRTVQLPEFESKYRQGWRSRAAEKKMARIAREEAERVLAMRKAEYRRWLASDDKEESVSFESFEQKYKEGWEARAAQKKRVRLEREERERQEAKRQAELAELQRKRNVVRDAMAAADLEDIRKEYARGVPYPHAYYNRELLEKLWKEQKGSRAYAALEHELDKRKESDWLKEWVEPRLGLSEEDKLAGEALLSEFGSKFMPNAYANFEKMKDVAVELQQIFNEEFSEPWTIKTTNPKWNSFNKVLEKFAKARTEYFICHDELCHYWLLSRFGVLSDKDFAQIDAQRLAVHLLPENVERAGYELLKMNPMEGKISDFAVKYAPESNAIYQKMGREFKELDALLSEVYKQRIKMDDVRYSRVLAVAVVKRNDLVREMNTLSLKLQAWYMDHKTMEKSSEDVNTCDVVMAKQLKPLVDALPSYIKDHALRPSIADSEMIAIPGRRYRMQRTEVTQRQWMAVMSKNPSDFKGADRPVENVSWEDCQEFIKRASQMDCRKYRLPTEEEWEFACRAGSTTEWGKRRNGECGPLETMGWYDGNSGWGTHPVALKEPNAWGLYDMHGNVSEWTSETVIRGGCWHYGARCCSASDRFAASPDNRRSYLGFRLATSQD
jgi:hypothetical protein